MIICEKDSSVDLGGSSNYSSEMKSLRTKEEKGFTSMAFIRELAGPKMVAERPKKEFIL